MALNGQCLAPSIPFANNEVSSSTQDPVNREAASFKALVSVICCVLAVAPILNKKLLALGESEECTNCSKSELEGQHLAGSPRS